jgi:nitroreductase
MDLIKAIAGRRAVREYSTEALSEATIRQLIDAAVRAPNAINKQPWAFTVVRDQGLLDQISDHAKAFVITTLATDPDAEHFRKLLEDPAFHIFYHAPVLILISAVADDPWLIEDCSLAAEDLMLSAYGEGIGTCWIGFAQRYLNSPEGRSALALPACWTPVAPIVVGHPKVAPPPVPNNRPIVHWVG